MQYRHSKRFNKKISRIGFGAWQLGNDTDFEGMSEAEALELVTFALHKGITLYDTAPNYAHGKSEQLLGQALEGTENEVFINTKVGHNHEGEIDFSLDGIARSIEKSMDNLRRDRLDSVILHNPSPDILQGGTGHYEYLQSLKKEGIINGYGVSIDTAEDVRRVLDHGDVDVIELMFNAIHQSPKVWFDEIYARDILLIIKVPFDSGWLTGRFDKYSEFSGIRSRWTKEDLRLRHSIIEDVKEIVGKEDLVPVALSFILSFQAVSSVIPGTRKKEHLDSSVGSLEYQLPEDIKVQLEELYDSKLSNLQIPW